MDCILDLIRKQDQSTYVQVDQRNLFEPLNLQYSAVAFCRQHLWPINFVGLKPKYSLHFISRGNLQMYDFSEKSESMASRVIFKTVPWF